MSRKNFLYKPGEPMTKKKTGRKTEIGSHDLQQKIGKIFFDNEVYNFGEW